MIRILILIITCSALNDAVAQTITTPLSEVTPPPPSFNQLTKKALSNYTATNRTVIFEDFSNLKFNLDIWKFLVTEGAKASLSIENNSNQKENFLRVNVDRSGEKNQWDVQLFCEDITVVPSTTYQYTMLVKGEKNTKLYFSVEDESNITLANKEISLSNQWRLVRLRFITTSNTIRIPIHFSYPQNNGASIYLDDLKLEKLDDSNISSLRTDFESEQSGPMQVSGWNVQIDNDAMASFDVVSNSAPGNPGQITQLGKVMVDAIGLENTWDIQMVHENIRISPQTVYDYSVWVKGTKEAEVYFSVEGPNYEPIASKLLIMTSNWQQIAFEFISEYDVVRSAIHFSYPDSFGSTIYIDDIEIQISE